MDNLTHSLVGYTLARAGVGRGTPGAALTLVLASNAPDIDIVTAFSGGSVGYLAAHRGLSHGLFTSLLIGAIVGDLVVAGLWLRARWRGASFEAPGRALLQSWKLGVIGAVLHIAMDLPTTYGTRILEPFAGTWFAVDWMPIIDVYLWAVLIGCLLWGRFRHGAAVRAAVVALSLTGAYYACRAVLHERALADAATRTAEDTRSDCATAPTMVQHPGLIEAAVAGPETCIQAAALPTFLSPFTWRAVRQYPGGYELSERSLLEKGRADRRVWIPSDSGPLLARARATPTGRVFLDFARFPAARIVQRSPEESVVRIADVRFVGHPVSWDPDARPRGFFVVTVVVGADGVVRGERLGP